jgi:Family of unknown function (DUF6527)
MTTERQFDPEFVEFIPEELLPNVLYISVEYGTVVHLCACGCGEKVVTPLTPTDWEVIYNGETMSLYPSVGNWSFPCRSHYFITDGEVRWAKSWSRERVEMNRGLQRTEKQRYFRDGDRPAPSPMQEEPEADDSASESQRPSLRCRFYMWLRSIGSS